MKYVQILSALLTPVIAIITTYIAIQQYRGDKAKLRHEVYEKRLKIYQATVKFLRRAPTGRGLDLGTILQFNVQTAEHSFLFGDEITDYLKLLSKKAARKVFLKRGYEAQEESREEHLELEQINEWFLQQQRIVHEQFMKYLNLKSIH